MRRFILVLAPVLGLVLFPSAALADRIDGDWCNSLGVRLDIKGPDITVQGKTFQGEYGRHEFLYTVPEGLEHAGEKIYLRLRGEDNMTSYTLKDETAVDPIDWKRCQAIS